MAAAAAVLAAAAGAADLAGAASPPRFPCDGEITTDRTNLRAGRSLNYEAVFRLDRGARVTVTGLEKGWYRIEAPEDVPCYVSTRYLAGGKVACGRLNVRAKPSEKATVLCQLDRGDEVDEIEEDGGWTAIKAPDCVELWVSAELIAIVAGDEEEGEDGGTEAAEAQPRPAQAPGPQVKPPDAARLPAPAGGVPSAAPPPGGIPCRRQGKIVAAETMGLSGAPYCLVQGFFFPSAVCLMDSRTINLSHHLGDKVRIWGYEVSRHLSGVPVIDVRRLEVE